MCFKIVFVYVFLALVSTIAGNDNSVRINTDLTARIISDPNEEKTSRQPHNAIANGRKVEIPLLSNMANSQNPNNNRNNSNICTREETYVEQIRSPSMQPVRVRSSKWCLEFPPRCSSYKTEVREIVKVQNVTKTRTIRFCCAGYEGNISLINETVCKPVCRGGCGRGYCQMPDTCKCEPGYIGKHCTQRCDHDHWGDGCKNVCQCQNDAVCDNKSGLCHCTSGWTGLFCEMPCPDGTHGIMCRNPCSCPDKRCHHKTGECNDGIQKNATHVMIETLNSTIANITHHLDRLAKNIDHIATTTTEPMFSIFGHQTTSKTMPEVILIKQEEQHSPKIIVHPPGSGLLDNLHGGAVKQPEVIHVITSWPPNSTHEAKLNLAGYGGLPTEGTSKIQHNQASGENSLLSTLLVILLIIVVSVILSFLYVYRRFHWQRERVSAVMGNQNEQTPPASNDVGLNESNLGKNFLKPLPDLPAFTQMMRNKIEGPELYDSPSNNSSIKTPPYAYARKESLYSVINHKGRKGSMDSHLYDEIPYPMTYQQQHQHHRNQIQSLHPHSHQYQYRQHHPQQPHSLSHSHQQHPHQQPQIHFHHERQNFNPQTSTTANNYHISELVIPPQNSNFLQVPSVTHVSHKVTHI